MPAATVRFLGRDLSAVIASSYRRTNRSRTAWAQPPHSTSDAHNTSDARTCSLLMLSG